MLNVFESPNCEYFVPEKAMYDSAFIRYEPTARNDSSLLSDLHSIGNGFIPLHIPFTVRIKPYRELTESEKRFTVMKRITGDESEVERVEWNSEWAKASFVRFGMFILLMDTLPPVLHPERSYSRANLSKSNRIAFTVTDNNGRFKNFRAELDGKWLRFTNDKGRKFIYNFDEKCARGEHELVVSVQDEAGNISRSSYRFTR